MAWEKICEPKNAGGLNVTSMTVWNQAIIAKLLRNLQAKAYQLWVKWINAYYLKIQDIMT